MVCLQPNQVSTLSDKEVALLSSFSPLFVSHHLSHHPLSLSSVDYNFASVPTIFTLSVFTFSSTSLSKHFTLLHPLLSPHHCHPPPQLNVTALDWSQLSKKECLTYGGSLVGKSCKYVPDLALMSFILFFGTYSMTVSLKKFKFSRYFPTKVTIYFYVYLFMYLFKWTTQSYKILCRIS